MKQLLAILIFISTTISATSTVTLYSLEENYNKTKHHLMDTLGNFDEWTTVLEKSEKTDITLKRFPANYEIHIQEDSAVTKISYLDVGLFQYVPDSNETNPIYRLQNPDAFNAYLLSSAVRKTDSILLEATGYKTRTEEESLILRAHCDSLREYMPLKEKAEFYEAYTLIPSAMNADLDSADSAEMANTPDYELFIWTYFAFEMSNSMSKTMKKAQKIMEEMDSTLLSRFISDAPHFAKQRKSSEYYQNQLSKDKIPPFYKEMGILRIDISNPRYIRYCWLSSALETTTLNVILHKDGTCKSVTAIFNEETFQQLYPKCLPLEGSNKFIILKHSIKGNQKL